MKNRLRFSVALGVIISLAACSTDANVDEVLLAHDTPQSRLGNPGVSYFAPENTYIFVGDVGTSIDIDLKASCVLNVICDQLTTPNFFNATTVDEEKALVSYYPYNTSNTPYFVSYETFNSFYVGNELYSQETTYKWIKVTIDGLILKLSIEPNYDGNIRRLFLGFWDGSPSHEIINNSMCITQLPPHATEDDYKVALQSLSAD